MQMKRSEVGEMSGVREKGGKLEQIGRRSGLCGGGLMLAFAPVVVDVDAQRSKAEPAPPPPPALCDEMCVASLDQKEEVTTSSGLRYQDIVVGKGPAPIQGFQVVVNYTGYIQNNNNTKYVWFLLAFLLTRLPLKVL